MAVVFLPGPLFPTTGLKTSLGAGGRAGGQEKGDTKDNANPAPQDIVTKGARPWGLV